MSSSQRSGQTYKYSIAGKRAKDALNKDEQELYELCCLGGVDMSPAVYRIVMNLLKMNVSPIAIVQMLKSMVNSRATSVSATSLTIPSSSAELDITGTGSFAEHGVAKRSASASAISGGSSTSRSLKGSSRSVTSVRSDASSGRSRSTKSSSSTKT